MQSEAGFRDVPDVAPAEPMRRNSDLKHFPARCTADGSGTSLEHQALSGPEPPSCDVRAMKLQECPEQVALMGPGL